MSTAQALSFQLTASTLHQRFFRGVIYAPTSYLSLGRAVDTLCTALDYLIDELNNPRSRIFREENEQAAREILQLTLYGANDSLTDVEDTLRSLRINRHRTERWWLDFSIKIRFNGVEKTLASLEERIEYHRWAFELAMRTLRKNETAALLTSAQTISIAVHLKRLMQSQLSASEDQDWIICRFKEHSDLDGGSLLAAHAMETVIRTSIFWTFKAIRALEHVPETKTVTAEGYVNMLKAAWMLQNVRNSPWLNTLAEEVQALIERVSMELLVSFKKFTQKRLTAPERHELDSEADFRVFLDDSEGIDVAEDDYVSSTLEYLTSNSEFSTLESPRLLRSVPYSSKSFYDQVPPTSPTQHWSTSLPLRRSSKIAKEDIIPESAMSLLEALNTFNLTPPLSPTQSSERTNSARTSLSSFVSLGGKTPKSSSERTSLQNHDVKLSNNTSRPVSLPVIHIPPPLSPTTQVIDEIYGRDSPTLGSEDFFEAPTRIGSYSTENYSTHSPPPSPVEKDTLIDPTERLKEDAIKPLRINTSLDTQYRSRPLPRLPLTPSPKSAKHMSAPLPSPLVTSMLISPIAPKPLSASHAGSKITWNTDVAVEYGVRPGEREIMPEHFAKMRLLASDTCKQEQSGWEDCLIRIFQNQLTGDFRILTLRGGKIDQKLAFLQGAELVPEYAYRDVQFPVVFLRKSGPGISSLQPSNRVSSSSHSIKEKSPNKLEIPVASLYYRFFNLLDMFTFHSALLGESIESDLHPIRSVRLSRSRPPFRVATEAVYYACRLQIWREERTTPYGRNTVATNSLAPSASVRSAPAPETCKVNSTRVVLYLDTQILTFFITDDITTTTSSSSSLPNAAFNIVKIKPSSLRTFNNPTSIKVRYLGNVEKGISGGWRLDREGVLFDDSDTFDEVKSIEIEFFTPEEAAAFREDVCKALQERRRQRKVMEALKRRAARGVKVGDVWA